MVLKNLDIWDVFHKNMETRTCILMKIPKWQGNVIVFPAPITIVLGNVYVLKTCFFCVSSKLKSVALFLAQANPNRCFWQKLFTFRDQKLRKWHAAGKAELPKVTWQLQNKSKIWRQKRYTRFNLTY
jgi:hypothetical protein